MARTALPASEAVVRVLSVKVEIDWAGTGSYTDETASVINVSGTSQLSGRGAGFATPGNAVADELTVTLDNVTGRFSPNNAAGPLYAHLSPTANPQNAGGYFRPIRVELGFGSGRLRVFTGVIVKPDEDWAAKRVTLTCRDRWAVLARKRASTTVRRGQRVDTLIAEWLTASGLGYATSTGTFETSERTVEWAWLDEDGIAEDINRLVEADGGLVYFDGDGALCYKSGTWPARTSSAVYTFTVHKFEELQPQFSFHEQYDAISAAIHTRYVGQQSVVWEGPDDLSLAPGETLTLAAHFGDPIYGSTSTSGSTGGVATPTYSTAEAQSDWMARNAANQRLEYWLTGALSGTVTKSTSTNTITGAGTAFTTELSTGKIIAVPGGSSTERFRVTIITNATSLAVSHTPIHSASSTAATVETTVASRVSVSVGNVAAQSADVTLVNGSTSQRAYLTKLQVRAQPVVSGKEGRASTGSGTQVLTLDNPYIQTRAHAAAVVGAAKQRQAPVRQTVTLRGVPGQPHLEVADRVRVTEADTGIDRHFFVGRIGWEYGPDRGYTQDLDLIDTNSWALYGSTSTAGGYFKVATHALGSSGTTGTARLWW